MKRLSRELCPGCGGHIDPDTGMCSTPDCDAEPDE